MGRGKKKGKQKSRGREDEIRLPAWGRKFFTPARELIFLRTTRPPVINYPKTRIRTRLDDSAMKFLSRDKIAESLSIALTLCASFQPFSRVPLFPLPVQTRVYTRAYTRGKSAIERGSRLEGRQGVENARYLKHNTSLIEFQLVF